MAVTTDDLEAFHRFAESKIDCGKNDFSFDELVEQWLLQEQGDAELAESVASMNRGLRDLEAGHFRPAEDVFRDLEHRFSLERPE